MKIIDCASQCRPPDRSVQDMLTPLHRYSLDSKSTAATRKKRHPCPPLAGARDPAFSSLRASCESSAASPTKSRDPSRSRDKTVADKMLEGKKPGADLRKDLSIAQRPSGHTFACFYAATSARELSLLMRCDSLLARGSPQSHRLLSLPFRAPPSHSVLPPPPSHSVFPPPPSRPDCGLSSIFPALAQRERSCDTSGVHHPGRGERRAWLRGPNGGRGGEGSE